MKEVAERSGRSLNRQIIYALEGAVRPRRADEATLLQRIKANRQQSSLNIDQRFLEDAINEGRL